MYLSKRSERDPYPCKRNKEIPEEQIQEFKKTQ